MHHRCMPAPTLESGNGLPPTASPRRIEPALLLGSVLLVLAVAALLSVRPWRRQQVAWSTDIAVALAEARKSHHLVFVEVGADWCDPCRHMERDTFTDSGVGRALAGFHPVHLNDDRSEVRRQMTAWGAVAIPAHFLLNPDGTIHAQTLGYLPPEAFLTWLRAAAAG